VFTILEPDYNWYFTPRHSAFTKYAFAWRLLCSIQPSFHFPRPTALPTLVQYCCTTIGQYTTPPPTSRVYAIYHTILVITTACKGLLATSLTTNPLHPPLSCPATGCGALPTWVNPFSRLQLQRPLVSLPPR